MKSRYTAGFTLIEMLTVIGIISISASVVLVSFIGGRNKNALSGAQDTIVRTLEKARNSAMAGVGAANYGVHIDATSISLFEGASYPGTFKGTNALPGSVVTNQTGADFIFSRITGKVNTPTSIILNQSSTGQTLTVSIRSDGQIIPQ